MSRRHPLWTLAAVLLLAPVLLGAWVGSTALTQVALAALGCWAFYLLWGQGGMLSFGHAVHSGLGAYGAVYALRALAESPWQGTAAGTAAVALVPLAGAILALLVAVPLGWLATRRAGTPFAMITLALGELVSALALMFPAWSGGDAGLSANRVLGAPLLGITWAPAVQVYALAAVYLWLGAALVLWFGRTGLGRLLNAVRDNPQRVAQLGHHPHHVRWWAYGLAAALAGAAGGLSGLLFEIVSPDVLGAQRSGAWLVFTVLGGAQHFFGPLLGGGLWVLAQLGLSSLTPAWLLYVGLAFIAVLLLAPGGLAALLLHARQRWLSSVGRRAVLLGWLVASLLVALCGVVLVEMAYHWQASAWGGHDLTLAGVPWATDQPWHWAVPAAGLVLAVAWLAWQRRSGRAGGWA